MNFTPPRLLKTAVLFLVFNRPDTTKQVFEQIRKAKPPKLYIAADGPRENVPGEAERVKEVREYVLNNIDWGCDVKTLFRDKNLGCKYAVSSAITWFFENEEQGIILEDDCLPSQSFFWYCEELLNKYKDDMRIGMITGTSYLFNEINDDNTYFFSKYFAIWGWATWKNRWQEYDVNMKLFEIAKKENLFETMFIWDNFLKNFYESYYFNVYKGQIDTWDAQWTFLLRLKSMYCITPYNNLIQNIGVEGTRGGNSPFIMMPVKNLDWDKFISNLESNHFYDLKIDKEVYYNVFYRFYPKNKLRKFLLDIENIIKYFAFK